MKNEYVAHNGWPNYATWNVPLWIDNESGTSELKAELIELALADSTGMTAQRAEIIAIECLGGESTPDLQVRAFDDDGRSNYGFRWADVDWESIAGHWVDEGEEARHYASQENS